MLFRSVEEAWCYFCHCQDQVTGEDKRVARKDHDGDADEGCVEADAEDAVDEVGQPAAGAGAFPDLPIIDLDAGDDRLPYGQRDLVPRDQTGYSHRGQDKDDQRQRIDHAMIVAAYVR